MQPQINRRPQWHGRKKALGRMFLAALVVLGGLAASYSALPKAGFYSVFREVNKHSIALQTKNWNSLRGSNFEIRYKPQDAAIAGLVLETAEQSVVPVNEMLGYTPQGSQGRMLVLVYPTREEMGKSFGWTGDQSAMGVYWAGIIRVLSPAAWIEGASYGEMENEFRSSGPMAHEYTHLVVDYITRGNYPRWLTEGIAQYVEREVTGFSFSDSLTSPEDGWFSLRELEQNFDTTEGQAKAYRQSLAMMDYLEEEYGQGTFAGILKGLGKGQSLNKAWKEQTGISLEEFEEDFQDWSRNHPSYSQVL